MESKCGDQHFFQFLVALMAFGSVLRTPAPEILCGSSFGLNTARLLCLQSSLLVWSRGWPLYMMMHTGELDVVDLLKVLCSQSAAAGEARGIHTTRVG